MLQIIYMVINFINILRTKNINLYLLKNCVSHNKFHKHSIFVRVLSLYKLKLRHNAIKIYSIFHKIIKSIINS